MGRLKVQAWRDIGAPDFIIDWVENGVKIPFHNNIKPPPVQLQNRVSGAREYNFIDSEIQKLLQQGSIIKCDVKPECVLPIQCVPKKNDKLRMVLDCRFVNKFIKAPKFKQEGIEAVAQQIEEDDVLISVDLKDGFHHVDMHWTCWAFFGMQWRECYYVWTVIPFGMSASPWIFRKILQPVTAYLREQGLRLALFVDDFFQMAKKMFAAAHKELLLDTLQDLGWTVNFEKSSLVPSFSCDFIGFTVHSKGDQGPWLQVFHSKIKKLKCHLRKALRQTSITARQLAKVAGQCIAMMRAVLPAKLLLRNVYRLLSSKQSWHSHLTLDKHAREDLQWWLAAINNWNGAPLSLKTPDIQVVCDASALGWGGAIPDLKVEAAGTWNKEVSFKHSNYRELLTILLVLKSFRGHLRRKHVQVLSDNVTAVAYVNHLGGRDPDFNEVVRAIFVECLENNITLVVRHLSGVSNRWADRLSRLESPYEWHLHPGVFSILEDMWGPHDVDRFASWRTTQLPVYNSLYADPYTSGVDAMARSWKGTNSFVNPPFFMLHKIINKIIQEKVEATVIAPVWKNQVWYRRLKQYAVAAPFLLKNTGRLMLKCVARPEPLKNPAWRIYAWRISGKGS